jgi:phage terminase large subunit
MSNPKLVKLRVPSLAVIRKELERRANVKSLVDLLPPKIRDLFKDNPRGSVLYRALHGGRGSGKSQSMAQMAAAWGYLESLRILCVREFQGSIKESFYAELKAAIEASEFLSAHYTVGVDYIRGENGTEFIFRGLHLAVNTIKSLAKIDLTIVEEAEDVSENAWLALEATVFRRDKSELWAIWNPRFDGSPVDLRFRKNPPARALIAEVNWQDNPYFPKNMEELRQREQRRLDPATYAHVWEGAYLVNSLAQVFNGKYRLDEFTPDPEHWDGPYYGGDFGFSQDPTAAVELWIHDETLYISAEAGAVGLELDDTASFVVERIPGFADEVSRWDNSRPESISHLRRHGLPKAEAVEKWKGSVEDGIAFMRAFREIVVHLRCKGVKNEMLLYSYKVDRLTGDIRSDLVDANNHYIDAIRYALGPMIRAGSEAMVFFTTRH